MRQGGMKPKGHNSGVYWVRANGSNKKSKQNANKKTEPIAEEDLHPLDGDHDGHVTFWEYADFFLTTGGVILVLIWLCTL